MQLTTFNDKEYAVVKSDTDTFLVDPLDYALYIATRSLTKDALWVQVIAGHVDYQTAGDDQLNDIEEAITATKIKEAEHNAHLTYINRSHPW
jgi:hypothetical protein